MKPYNPIILIISIFIVGSCSIEKRLYNKGYSVLQHKSFRHSSHDEIGNLHATENSAASTEREKQVIPVKLSVLTPTDSVEQTYFLLTEETDTLNFYSAENRPNVSENIRAKAPFSELKKVTKNPLQYRGSGGRSPWRLIIFGFIFALIGLALIYNPGYYGLGILFGLILLAAGAFMVLGAIMYITFYGF